MRVITPITIDDGTGVYPDVCMGDPDWDDVALALNFEQANGTTVMVDSSKYGDNKNITSGASIQAAAARHGSAGLQLNQIIIDSQVWDGTKFNSIAGKGATIEFYFKTISRVNGTPAPALFMLQDLTYGNAIIEMGLYGDTNLVTIRFENAFGDFRQYSYTPDANGWVHVVICIGASGGARVYLNQVLVVSRPNTECFATGAFGYSPLGCRLFIGRWAGGPNTWAMTCYIDSFRYTTRDKYAVTPPTASAIPLCDGPTSPESMGSLYYSSITEPTLTIDPNAWIPGSAYAIGTNVSLATTHKVYQAITNVSLGDTTSPDVSVQLAVPKWVEIGSTNKFAMFDLYRSTPSIFSEATMTPSVLEGTGDPYYDQVVFLADFEDTVGGGAITDKSKYNNTVTVVGSGNIISTDSKFGTRSWQAASSSYFTVALGTNGSMTGDFTWECHYKSVGNDVMLYSTTGLGYMYNNYFQDYGGPLLVMSTYNSGLVWDHIAICRQGSTLRSFKNGVLQATVTYSGTVNLQTCRYGYYVPNGNLYYQGRLDGLRITKDVARYTTNFTPPTGPYLAVPEQTIKSAKVEIDVVSTDNLSLALLDLINVGKIVLQCVDNSTSTIISTTSIEMNTRDVYDWWTYFTTQFIPKKSLILNDLPTGHADMRVIIHFVGSDPISVGTCIIGPSTFIGRLHHGAELDILNFSTMERDTFGNAILVPRREVSTLNATLYVDKSIFEDVQAIKADLDAKPAVWVGIDNPEDPYYYPLIFLGIYRDFNFQLDNPIGPTATLELEEM